jgi:hypothetical protein
MKAKIIYFKEGKLDWVKSKFPLNTHISPYGVPMYKAEDERGNMVHIIIAQIVSIDVIPES